MNHCGVAPNLLAVLVLGLGATFASAQVPEKFKNLEVLPKDISRKDLVQTMRGWASALDVRCGHCHVGGNPDTLEGVDFASDEKWEKRTARAMLRMVRAVESGYLQPLESRPLAPGAQAEPEVTLTCATCHHGLRRPEALDVVLDRVVREKGAEAALRTYRDLRTQYLGRGTYDFSDRPLNTVAERLIQENRAGDAVLLLEMGAELNPDAAWLQHLLGEARLAAGDRAGAFAAFEVALNLNPQNDSSRRRVEELRASVEAAPGPSYAFSLEPNHSTVGFSIPIMGGITRVTGKFKQLEGRIVMNEKIPSRSSVAVTITAASLDTGIDERDAHLRRTEFFDTAAYPLITFRSTRVERTAEGYRAVGALGMRGVEKEIVIPFRKTGLEWKEGRPLLGIAGELKLRRSDFGVGTSWQHSDIPNFVGDEVDVQLFVWTRLGQPVAGPPP
jgi:polyisoprenoid-binding protein YceI